MTAEEARILSETLDLAERAVVLYIGKLKLKLDQKELNEANITEMQEDLTRLGVQMGKRDLLRTVMGVKDVIKK